jgi:two-component system LytT family sensor kinase
MMEMIPIRQLFKTALITAPLMGLMLVTPPYVLFVFEKFNFFVVWAGISGVIFLAWTVNITIIYAVRKKWTLGWMRVAVVFVIMFGLSYIGIYLFGRSFNIDAQKINAIRVVNILAVNIIIHILIDMAITKENKNKVELENAKLRFSNLEAEYKALKDQVNPHFLFNALSTAKALVRQKPELAEEYIVKLSDFLRASINNDKKTVSLKDEISMCDDFIGLNKIRFGEAIRYEKDVQTNTSEHFVPYFSLTSLLENVIKHNQFTKETPIVIKLTATDETVSVSNSKKEKFRIEDSPKTGLKNLNERYKLLTGNSIEVKDSNDQFKVSMSLLHK